MKIKLEGYRSLLVGFSFLLAALIVYLVPVLLIGSEVGPGGVELAKALVYAGAGAFSIGKMGEAIKYRGTNAEVDIEQ